MNCLATSFVALVLAFCTLPIYVLPPLAADEFAPTNVESRYFETDVRPIFKAMCFQCHGEDDDLAGGLDLRMVRLMRSGGDSGEAVVSSITGENLLWMRIVNDEMPPGAKKLSQAEKELVRQWISAGAQTRRPEPESVEEAKYTAEELDHWAFQPVSQVPIPDVSSATLHNPIDAFIVQRLQELSLSQSPPAERSILLRRVTFDLTGLPPTPAELDAFSHDSSPDAYEKVVDRLLGSHEFGVRWGGHWLDVAGYSESEGHLAEDVQRAHAWRYRDYVVNALNGDKSYDLFLQEQLAGDELIVESITAQRSGESLTADAEGSSQSDISYDPDADNERHVEWLTATGLLQMAPDLTSKSDTLNDRNQVLSETIKIVSSVALGLTIGCAQCHDHRYDPVSTEDYYSLRAVFDPALPINSWKRPEKRLIDMTPNKTLEEIARIDAVCREKEAVLGAQRRKLAEQIYERLVNELPAEQRTAVIAAAEKAAGQRDDEEKRLLDQFPMFNTVDSIVEKIVVYDSAKHKEFFDQQTQIDALREAGPKRRLIMSANESSDQLPVSTVFARGDPLSPKREVGPREVFVLTRGRENPAIPMRNPSLPTSGRRLAYARQLTDGSHRTVARVAVNRVWAHHFGRGLVSTLSDFGLNGEPPTHPELLDWLSKDFVDHGWQMKRLHRMIVLSHTYQQTSMRTAAVDSVDPNNLWLSRMNLRRLDAEELRDAMLATTGLLNSERGGPSVPIATQLDGQTVVGKAVFNNGGLFEKVEQVGDEQYRRSVYISHQRLTPLTMLVTFDAPIMAPNCDQRQLSTVAPQSLWFLNDAFVVEITDKLSERLLADQLDDPVIQVRTLFRRFYSVEPSEEEMQTCLSYLRLQAEQLRRLDDPQWAERVKSAAQLPEVVSFATLCHSLLSTNRFLYVE